jgi:hypothetical protein
MMPASRVLALIALALTVAACGARPPRYHYYDAQLGRRTWEVHAHDDRFALYRAAELTQGFGYRYFTVRSYTGDDADYRFFTVTNLSARKATSSPFPAVTDESERQAAKAVVVYARSETRRRVTFRLLDPEEIGDGSDAVDAEAVLRHLAPFIGRRR